MADLLAWSVFLFLLIISRTAKERSELLFCLLIATLGEIFLGFIWKLYEYRLHNLPLFIPPGHAVVYAAGRAISRSAPNWLPRALAIVLVPFVGVGVFFGYDTQAALWFGVLLLCLLVAPDRRFAATMFILALLIETLGTTLGAWRYLSPDPWFGMSTLTKPPLWAGTFYCALDVMVAFAALRTVRAGRAPHGSPLATARCAP